MIAVGRLPKPTILLNKETEWLNAYTDALEALSASPADKNLKRAKDLAEGRYGHQEIRDQLRAMFSGKCAFCESHISHVTYDHIEHFRPKQQFPEFCFEWGNLLLASSMCNGAEFKGTKFPEAQNGGPFVNPVEDEPNDFFDFIINLDTKLAEVNPRNTRGETTERELGLNRLHLLKHRSQAVMNIFMIAKIANDGDTRYREALIKNCQPDSEYAAFARSIAKRFGIDWEK